MSVTHEQAIATLTTIWEQLLGVPARPDDDFFDLGGNSLLVVDVVHQARTAGLPLKALDVFSTPTIAALAEQATGQRPDPGYHSDFRSDMVAHVWRTSVGPWDPSVPASLVPLRRDGEGAPLFCVHLGSGHVRLFTDIAPGVGNGRPVYGFEAIGYRAAARPFLSVGETAQRYLDELRAVQPTGPYHLSGLCAGAVIALEMAQRLRAAGEQVASLILVDLPYGMPELDPGWGVNEHFEYLLGSLRSRFGLHDPVADLPKVLDELKDLVWFERTDRIEDFYRLVVLWAAAQFAQEHYEPRRYDGPVAIISPAARVERVRSYWSGLLPEATVSTVESTTMMRILAEPVLAEVFATHLSRSTDGR